jgi:hypothetical protein
VTERRNEISVEYEILVTVKIDEETKKITGVYAHPDDFNAVTPYQIWTGGSNNPAWDREYLDKDDPRHQEFSEVAESIYYTGKGDLALPFEER